MGLSLAAWRAGRYPNTTPMVAEKTNASITISGTNTKACRRLGRDGRSAHAEPGPDHALRR